MATSLFGTAGLGAPQLNKPPKKPKPPGLGAVGTAGSALTSPKPSAPSVGAAGGALLSSKPPAVNPGVGSAGGALLGAAGGGGAGSGAGAAATTTAPPPAAPAPYAIPTVPEDETAKTNAQTQYGTDTASILHTIQDAALAYGDPSVISQWGLGSTVNPNSALAMAALAHQQQTQAQNDTTEQAGNFFSSVHGRAQGDIDSAQQRAQQAGYQTYQDALGAYTHDMSTALNTLNTAINNANLDERTQALNSLPTSSTVGGPAAGGGGGGGGGATGGGAAKPAAGLSIMQQIAKGHPNWFPKGKK